MSYFKPTINDSYIFYENILKSPKFVVAPMVGRSELPWRMLARKHGAHLCYTPMFNAKTMLLDKNYCKDVLQDISSSEDRPLIVQFCANTAEHFVNAALLVEDYCDGVDLNLGCPQHIAQRGHFGAFLQDDWDILQDIISQARQVLKIGVTAKIRVFAKVSKTIEYAQMLESAGCNMLTVHGRTRDQKREKTGLADWSQIKAVKANVNIPVIANGNIQYAADIHHCIAETGVDGVMTAEGHLSNPHIFQDAKVNVFDVIDEYLSFVETYPTNISYIRGHIFSLLAHVLERHREMRNMLGSTSMVEVIKLICGKLRKICEKEEKEMDISNSATPYCIVASTGLPYWICQPYNRHDRHKKEEDNQKSVEPVDESKMTKGEKRRQAALQKKLASRALKRAEEHKRRRERDKNIDDILLVDGVKKNRVLRAAEKKQSVLDRLESVMRDDSHSIVVCLDLSWCDAMNDKEINKLSSQLGRLYGSNRNSRKPAHLYFTGFHEDGKLWRECVRKHDGFKNYKIEMTSQPYMELFQSRDIIYLTPDAPTALESVEPGSVYVLGGLVDETVTKKLTLDSANEAGICTRRLPVDEYMIRSGRHSNYSTVYCVNQVFDILLTYHNTQSWREALNVGVPARKGYVLKEHFNKVSELS